MSFKNVHISTTRCLIEMGFGLKCSVLNGQVIYLEKSKSNIADMWLIPFERVTYSKYVTGTTYTEIMLLDRAVASLTVPGGQEFHFPHFFLKFQLNFLFFLNLYLFSSSFWPSGWASRPPGKAPATPLLLEHIGLTILLQIIYAPGAGASGAPAPGAQFRAKILQKQAIQLHTCTPL